MFRRETSVAADALPWSLEAYSPALNLTGLAVGVDNVRHDVCLSPRFQELGQRFLFELILQHSQAYLSELYPSDARRRSALVAEFRRTLLQLLQTALTQAKEKNSIAIDVLARLSLYKWLTAEMQRQFAQLTIAGKERAQSRGGMEFEGSMESFRLKARIADFQINKRHILRAVAEALFGLLEELEDSNLRTARHALFGEDFGALYSILRNRLVFLENPTDAYVHIEHYVMLGHFQQDVDREDRVVAVVADLLKERVLAISEDSDVARAEQQQQYLLKLLQGENARLREVEAQLTRLERSHSRTRRWLSQRPLAEVREETRALRDEHARLTRERDALSRRVEEAEQTAAFVRARYETRLADILCNPANARELFGAVGAPAVSGGKAKLRSALLDEFYRRLEQHGMLKSILASYYLKPFYKDFCPPLNPQQLKKAVLDRREQDQLELFLEQFTTRAFPLEKIDSVRVRLRRVPRDDARAILLRFARDLANLRRDARHLHLLSSGMEKIHLLTDEKTRRISQLNGTLYEFLLPEERQQAVEHILTHVIVKADIRDSTRITAQLVGRGLNPATHFSLHFYEPVRKILDRYEAAKVFIEGDALILAIYETESNRAFQRPVARACCLAKEILQVSQSYNQKAEAQDLPRLELGLGIAFHGSAPTFWVDGETQLMISRAINLSDRLSSCSRVARRLIAENNSPFKVFLFQGYSLVGGAAEEEEEFLVRYNVNGIELNEEGFEKLRREISLTSEASTMELAGARQPVQLHYGVVPLGTGFEKLIIREARVPSVELRDLKVKSYTQRRYFEVCTHPQLYARFPQTATAS
ncbi:MAG: hypothetical protein HY653_07955 [Acidobacteria bacterium]|nr:hypothetical protein [Acidobacteriota bacterium]